MATDKNDDKDDEVKFVCCPECGVKQADMGANVACEVCGFGPMPYYKDGELID